MNSFVEETCYQTTLKKGISRSKEFEKKCLSSFAVNPGLKCSHHCTYCSTGASLWAHPFFKEIGRSAFDNDYTVFDTDTYIRVAHDAKHKRKRGLVQISTIDDAWSPVAQEHNMGRRCLEAILAEPGWSVRVLTKNAAVADDFDLIYRYRDRVLVGLSITAPPGQKGLIDVIEPYASPIQDRIKALEKAHQMGLRTYAMFCPLLPGIADAPEQIDELVQLAVDFGAEEIFAEPVNPRGRGLILTQEALQENGYVDETESVGAIRKQDRWSEYVLDLIKNVQKSVRTYSNTDKLRFLLYSKSMLPEHIKELKDDDKGIIWL